MTINILIADDHIIIRESLRCLLNEQPGMHVVAEAADGREAVHKTQECKPDIVIMDIGMPHLNGIEATRQIMQRAGHIKVIGFSIYAERKYVVNMLKAGAVGYVTKSADFNELIRAIHTVNDNKIYLSPLIANFVIEELLTQSSPLNSNPSVLTPREREVLQLLTEGNSTKEVATTLHVSTSTIETHRKQAMDKLNLHSIAELTKYAIREGMTFLEGYTSRR